MTPGLFRRIPGPGAVPDFFGRSAEGTIVDINDNCHFLRAQTSTTRLQGGTVASIREQAALIRNLTLGYLYLGFLGALLFVAFIVNPIKTVRFVRVMNTIEL